MNFFSEKKYYACQYIPGANKHICSWFAMTKEEAKAWLRRVSVAHGLDPNNCKNFVKEIQYGPPYGPIIPNAEWTFNEYFRSNIKASSREPLD